jgi:hypothetical protein
VQDDWNDTKTAIAGYWVTWLAHIVPSETIFDIEVDVEDIVHVILLDHSLQLLIFTPNLLQVLRVQFLLSKVDKNAPSPVLLLQRILHRLNLDADQPSRHQKGHNILRLAYNFPNLSPNLFSLHHQLLLSPDHFFLRNSSQILELLQFVGEFCLDFG